MILETKTQSSAFFFLLVHVLQAVLGAAEVPSSVVLHSRDIKQLNFGGELTFCCYQLSSLNSLGFQNEESFWSINPTDQTLKVLVRVYFD